MLHSLSPSKSPQSKSNCKSFICKKAQLPHFMWIKKKLGETIKADFYVFKVCSTICKEERTTTAYFTGVKQSSKSLQGTFVLYNCRKLNQFARVSPKAQADTLLKWLLFDLNKNSVHVHEKVGYHCWQWYRACWCQGQMLLKLHLIKVL